ncbi:hypothetical protein KM043_001243 [Ampulex compressa]|nr:hypothetical protein KM043_001243 [Ampulex compressa]
MQLHQINIELSLAFLHCPPIGEQQKANDEFPMVLVTLEVKYGDKVVHLGTELTPTQAHQVPEIHYKHDGGVLYTLILTDADVPTKGYTREFRHWIVGNIPEEDVAKGEVLAEYVGPAPPKGTGKHRYVFLIYRQNQGSITFDERRLGTWDGRQRRRFSTKKFVEKYNLVGPIAGFALENSRLVGR